MPQAAKSMPELNDPALLRSQAYVDGAWWVVDATRLAPRESMVRISTGRDAADIAFLTNHWADLVLTDLRVLAVVDALPLDRVEELVQLG